MSAHIKGPFQAVRVGRRYEVRTVTTGLGMPLAKGIVDHADAKLFAASPALLAALKAMVEAFPDSVINDASGQYDAKSDALEAISLAEGTR